MKSKNSTHGTITNVITKQNRNNSTSTYYHIKWDNERQITNPPLEYATKNIVSLIPSPLTVEQQQKNQQYIIECQNRRVSSDCEESVKNMTQMRIQSAQNRREQQSSSKLLNRIHNRVSNSEENYLLSNTTLPSINIDIPQVDDGSFINQDAKNYEVIFFCLNYCVFLLSVLLCVFVFCFMCFVLLFVCTY
jgi:hypothetical protein